MIFGLAGAAARAYPHITARIIKANGIALFILFSPVRKPPTWFGSAAGALTGGAPRLRITAGEGTDGTIEQPTGVRDFSGAYNKSWWGRHSCLLESASAGLVPAERIRID